MGVVDLGAERVRRRPDPPDTISRCRNDGEPSTHVVFPHVDHRTGCDTWPVVYGLCAGCASRMSQQVAQG